MYLTFSRFIISIQPSPGLLYVPNLLQVFHQYPTFSRFITCIQPSPGLSISIQPSPGSVYYQYLSFSRFVFSIQLSPGSSSVSKLLRVLLNISIQYPTFSRCTISTLPSPGSVYHHDPSLFRFRVLLIISIRPPSGSVKHQYLVSNLLQVPGSVSHHYQTVSGFC